MAGGTGGVVAAWHDDGVPPTRRSADIDLASATAVLLAGPEDFLAERAVDQVVAAATAADPSTEVRTVALGSEAAPGVLAEALSPNLFGDAAVVVGRDAESADDAVVDLLCDAVGSLPEGVRLAVLHPGGVKGRGVLTRLEKAGFPTVRCDRPKGRAVDDFVDGEFHRLGRRAAPGAVATLRSALGDDLRLLAAAAGQLCSDVERDPVEAADVTTYYDGVADMPGYLISDAVWDGRTTEVVRRTRWALVNDPGIGPAISAAVASGLRQLGRYTSAPRGMKDGELAAFVGAPPFKLRALREQATRWHPAALARAVGELAVTDAAVKGRDVSGRRLEDVGLDRDQGSYRLERTLLRIVSRRS